MLATFDADTHIIEARWQATDAIKVDYIFRILRVRRDDHLQLGRHAEFLYGTTRPATYEQTTHELRVSWDNGGPINAVVGGYLWDSSMKSLA
jgi:iron complex outermembrane receptor protein